MRNVVYILTVCVCVLVLACRNSSGTHYLQADSYVDNPDTVPVLTRMRADSLVFRLTHHYTNNFNFCVKADSMRLFPAEGDFVKDTCVVYGGDLLVVANIKVLPEGDVWVKVAHDQHTMGWVEERELLAKAVPDDNISKAIDLLSDSRTLWMSMIVGLGVLGFIVRRAHRGKMQMLKFEEMDSFYPTLFLLTTSVLATVYACVQVYVPEYWQEYYFNPTLNPLVLPPVMAVLVSLAWLLVIVFVAVVEEVYHHFYFTQGVVYLFEMTGLAMVVYLAFSWLTLCGVGMYILPLFVIAMLWVYFRFVRCSYVCGECGRRMRSLGMCDSCGTRND